MKQMRKRFRARFIMVAGAVALATGCSSRQPQLIASAYQFEPEARKVVAQAGIKSSRDPKLALDASGTLYLLSVAGEDGDRPQLNLLMSHDGGDTFMGPVPVSERGVEINSHGENSPSLVVRPTEIYVLFEQTTEGRTELMFARSITFGHSFEKPVRVTDKVTPSFNGFSSMSAAPNGDVYAIWLDGRDQNPQPANTFSIYLAKSTDRGATFSKNVRVTTAVCPCCRPAVAFGSHGEVHVAWRKVFDGDIRDMVVSTSTDNGASFPQETRVAVDSWKLTGCPHTGPAIIHSGERLYVAWYTEGADEKPALKLSSSVDDGKTFSQPIVASQNLLDPNHPAISTASDGRVSLAFQGRDPNQQAGWSPVRAYVVEITSAGEASTPQPVSDAKSAISYPVIIAGTAGRVFVSWTESAENNIWLVRGRR
jgi:hypothetical protein